MMGDAACRFSAAMQDAADQSARTRMLLDHLAEFGITRFAYANTSRRFPTLVLETSYPDAWIERYLQGNYRDFDPVPRRGRCTVMPFRWRPLLEQPWIGTEGRRVFDEASEFGILDGLTVPIHGADGFALMSMVIEDDALFEDGALASRHALHMMALYYHDAVERHALPCPSKIALSPREREVLLWTSRGKTSWEIAQILKVSERTAVFHIENAKTKLGVASRSHAAIKAIMLNLISP
jgi:LuxR family transcriptional regulator, activator of conjugal transfer of Ti plasmids